MKAVMDAEHVQTELEMTSLFLSLCFSTWKHSAGTAATTLSDMLHLL